VLWISKFKLVHCGYLVLNNCIVDISIYTSALWISRFNLVHYGYLDVHECIVDI